MPKFEKNDLITRNDGPRQTGGRRRVIRVTDSGLIDIYSPSSGATYIGCDPDMYTLVQRAGATDESMAKDLLVSLGYTVEPPKPKLKLSGKMNIIKTASGAIFGYPVDQVLHKSATILTTIDWTEGDGI